MARAGAKVILITGLRVATELTFGTATLGLLIAVLVWWKTGFFYLFSDTAPLLEQLVFCAVMLGGLFALVWLMAWQRIELHADTQELRVASIKTGHRWRTWKAKDIAKIGYFYSSKSLGQLLLSGSVGTRDVAILEDSLFSTEPSQRLKKVAAFVRTHNPDVKIVVAPSSSSANQADPN